MIKENKKMLLITLGIILLPIIMGLLLFQRKILPVLISLLIFTLTVEK